jgi:hypothetical protein
MALVAPFSKATCSVAAKHAGEELALEGALLGAKDGVTVGGNATAGAADGVAVGLGALQAWSCCEMKYPL